MSHAWDAEVAVVGAGPAGAWAALRLAQRGRRVLLFDDSHPREKPCGGGVTGRALALIRRAVPGFTVDGIAVDAARFSLDAHPRTEVRLGRNGATAPPPLVIVDRTRFDRSLADAAEQAGARWVRERVRDVHVDGRPAWDAPPAPAAPATPVTLVTARGRYTAGTVVGADGANSLVRRRVYRPFDRADLSIAAGYYAHDRSASAIEIGFVDDPAGYLWSFPRTDHLALGICAQADESTPAPLLARLDAWMRATGVGDGARLARYGWPIPSLDDVTLTCQPPAGPGWLLLGDAAGLVDPITREGIYFALESGELAAAALETSDPTAAYLEGLWHEILPELTRAARLKRRFFRSGFTGLMVDALATSTAIRKVMADLVAGRQPYATLKRRLVATLHVSLAWRLWRMERRGGRPAVRTR